MRQQHIATISLAGVVLATPANAAPFNWREALELSATSGLNAVIAGYRAAPALMLCLGALFAVPLMALAASIGRWRRRRKEVIAIASRPLPAADAGDGAALHASLEVVGKNKRIEILNDMLRIGREDDNDIRIRSQRVHRYHAAIHREEFGVYRITDLAGGANHGLSINGKPCEDAELKDGDLIALGPGRLKFHAGLV